MPAFCVKRILHNIREYRSNINFCGDLDVSGKGVGRNFSRGGLSGAPGEGSQPFFNFQGGAQPRFLVASMVKIKEFHGEGGIAPLPVPAYAYECT